MRSIGDDAVEIQETLREASSRCNLVIVTGGLGPTDDDRTARAAASAFGLPMVLHGPSLERIRERFKRLGFEMTPNNERQAYVPEGADVISNSLGTAPGFALDVSECLLVFVPGVPRELERMLDESVLPLAHDRFARGRVVRSRTLKVFGLTESKMDQMVQGALDGIPGVSLASLPRYPENRLRVTVREDSHEHASRALEEAEGRLRERIGTLVYGLDDQELESVVEDLLRAQGKTLAVAESCTGGLIAHRLTNVAGSSDVLDRGVVTYSLQAKTDILGVTAALLRGPGPVSAEVAEAMAMGVRKHAGTTLGLATTGVAGPSGGTEDIPVGTVFVGLADDTRSWSRLFRLRGGRANIKQLAATIALDWLRRYLLGEAPTAYPEPWK
jgi:nicotinamide-nucleotide amidase